MVSACFGPFRRKRVVEDAWFVPSPNGQMESSDGTEMDEHVRCLSYFLLSLALS